MAPGDLRGTIVTGEGSPGSAVFGNMVCTLAPVAFPGGDSIYVCHCAVKVIGSVLAETSLHRLGQVFLVVHVYNTLLKFIQTIVGAGLEDLV